MTTDSDLLSRFAKENAQDAFAEIARRHLNLVYSAALRQVRSPQLAEEVAQSVFSDLARNAAKLKPGTVLTAWLYAVTRRSAVDTIRRESRRQLREQIAVEMNDMNATTDEWTQIAPLLDDAMAELDETDRTAVLLRFFENKTLREVGQALGATDDAAQKRVSRAVDRLREFFSKQNVTIGTGGLVVLISTNAVHSAPAGLSAAILTATAGTTTTLGITMIHKLLITSLIATVGTGVYTVHLQKQTALLQQQQASLAQQIQQLTHERDDAKNQLITAQQANEQLNSNTELLKLRGEMTRLRNQQTISSHPISLHATNQSPRTGSSLQEAQTNTPSIQVTAAFVNMSEATYQSLSEAWTKPDVHLSANLRSKDFRDFFSGYPDVNILGTPSVITPDGKEATTEVVRSVEVNGTNANLGVILDVMPTIVPGAGGVDLKLHAELRELADDATSNIRTTVVEATPGVKFNNVNTNTPDSNHIVMLPTKISDNLSGSPRYLVVFVTANAVDPSKFKERLVNVIQKMPQ